MAIIQVRTLARSNIHEIKRFAKFAIVGAFGSITDFAILNILVQFFGQTLGIANAISVCAAIVQNFALNRLWTFPESRERQAKGQLMQFALVSIVGLGINQVVLLGVHHLLEPSWIALVGEADLGFTFSYNFAKLIAIGLVLFWNFGINRMWTYRGL